MRKKKNPAVPKQQSALPVKQPSRKIALVQRSSRLVDPRPMDAQEEHDLENEEIERSRRLRKLVEAAEAAEAAAKPN